jgi:hypothetical protein
MKRTSITFRGREVRNPLARKLVVVWVILFMVVVWSLMLALSPLIILTHYVLCATGRHGFVYRAGSSYSINIDARGFRRV